MKDSSHLAGAVAEKSKHTKGPWAVNPFNAQVDSAVNGTPVPVCQMLWPTTLRSEDETEANARLIAAAPRLLSALRWTVKHDGECLGDHPMLLEAAQALLAEVEGE